MPLDSQAATKGVALTAKTCTDCGEAFDARRPFDYCIACARLPKRNKAVTYVLSSSGFKNNGCELVTVEQHFENQQHNHVRG